MQTDAPPLAKSPWPRRILLAILVLGVLYAALLFLLSRFLDPGELAARLEPRLEAAVGREVEIGAAEVGFFPLGMRLTDIVVSDPTGMAPALARVASVDFHVAFFPLLRKEIQLRRLLIQEPWAHLRIGPDGQSNFGDLSPGSPEETAEAEAARGEEDLPFGLALDAIRVSGGQIRFTDIRDSTEASLENLEVRASVRRIQDGPWTFAGSSDSDLSLAMGSDGPGLGGIPLALAFDLSADPAFQGVDIRSGSVGVEGAALDLSGTVRGLKDPVRSLSLSLNGEGISLQRIAAALPDSLRNRGPEVQGILSANLQVEGDLGPDTSPEVSGTARLEGVSVSSRNGTQLARDLSSDFTLSPDGVLRMQARGEVMDGPFSLAGQAETDAEMPLDLQVSLYPDLALAGGVTELPEGVTMEGRLKVEGRLTGPAREPRNLRFWGEASPAEIRLTTPALGVPIRLPGGRLTLQGNQASFQDLPFSLGQDDLVLSGEASDLTGFGLPGRTVGLRGSVRGARLNLVPLSPNPPPDPDITYGKVAFARLGGRQVAGSSVEEAARALRLERPDSLPLAGEVTFALDTVMDARGRMHDVRGTVSFGPDFIRVPQASFQRYGGDLQAGLSLSLGDAGPEPFSMQLTVTGLDAGDFLAATSPLGAFVRGRLSLSMEMAGTLDDLLLPERSSLVGTGNFDLTDGGLNANRVTGSLADFFGMEELRAPDIRDWATGFVLENGMVRLADAILAQAPGEPRVGGSVGLGGELDLLSAFTLPTERLGSFALENLGIAGEIAGRVANRPEVVEAVVRIGGSIMSPNLRADPEATAEALGTALREEVASEARNRVREQTERLQDRATGFLQGLTRSRESPPPPAPDTLQPDSLPGDTLRADSVRPDTTPPDTLLPDSLRPDTLLPDTILPDSVRPDTTPPDTTPPDTTGMDSLRPDTTGVYPHRLPALRRSPLLW